MLGLLSDKEKIEAGISPPVMPFAAAGTDDEDWAKWAVERLSKSQAVRMMDVWIIGPIGIYYALKPVTKLSKFLIFLVGAGTIWYNYNNYVHNKKWLEELKQKIGVS